MKIKDKIKTYFDILGSMDSLDYLHNTILWHNATFIILHIISQRLFLDFSIIHNKVSPQGVGIFLYIFAANLPLAKCNIKWKEHIWKNELDTASELLRKKYRKISQDASGALLWMNVVAISMTSNWPPTKPVASVELFRLFGVENPAGNEVPGSCCN